MTRFPVPAPARPRSRADAPSRPAATRLVLFGAPALLACAGCRDRPAETAARAAPAADARLVTVDTLTVAVPLALPAQLYVEHDAVVFARSPGVVRAVHADLGTPVRAGQVLAELEHTDQAIALARAEQTYENARRTAERQRALAASGSATRAETEQVDYEYHQAELALRKARRDYELTRIVAPFAGVVTARAARPERLVSEGDTLFRVTAAAPLLAAVHVPEASPVEAREGTTAEVVDAHGRVAPARVVRTSSAVDPASGTREAVLAVESRPGLVPGAGVTVRLGGEPRRVLVVPRAAIGEDGYALVWNDDRTALRAVTLGADLGSGRVEVLGGLAPGERLVRPGGAAR